MAQNQYFRAGTGCVIFDDQNQILVFKRAGNNEIWQFQQGGMDKGEEVDDTLWRELVEETGLLKTDFTEVTSYPGWLYYEYPPEVKKTIRDNNCLGQTHRWFFLKIKSDTVVDLLKAHDHEFNDYNWTTFPDLVEATSPFKKEVYAKLQNYFIKVIAK